MADRWYLWHNLAECGKACAAAGGRDDDRLDHSIPSRCERAVSWGSATRRHPAVPSSRSPFRPTTTVDPSCPATPNFSGSCPAGSQTTSAVMNATAMIKFAVLRQAAREMDAVDPGLVKQARHALRATQGC